MVVGTGVGPPAPVVWQAVLLVVLLVGREVLLAAPLVVLALLRWVLLTTQWVKTP